MQMWGAEMHGRFPNNDGTRAFPWKDLPVQVTIVKNIWLKKLAPLLLPSNFMNHG
jgi:hypothetical protein